MKPVYKTDLQISHEVGNKITSELLALKAKHKLLEMEFKKLKLNKVRTLKIMKNLRSENFRLRSDLDAGRVGAKRTDLAMQLLSLISDGLLIMTTQQVADRAFMTVESVSNLKCEIKRIVK